MEIIKELYLYIKDNILTQYADDNSGHGIQHIEYVIRRCLKFGNMFDNIDPNILYTAASYHDIAHKIDKKNHETLSAQMFMDDEKIKSFFNDKEIIIIKEAIEDHRASANHTPRSIYGKILSSADRSTDVDEFFRRTHAYTLKHFPDSTQEEILQRALTHTREKYGDKGYAKHYINDEEYTAFLNEIHSLLSNENSFYERYIKVNR